VPPASPSDPVAADPRIRAATERYWRSNRRIVGSLLLVWAFVGLGCGVLLAEWLNQFHLGGCPLGFWFAQQGSIVAFVLLILCYAILMARLDRRHRRELDALRQQPAGGGR
jgi:putative solute:sodium symporter small subunit